MFKSGHFRNAFKQAGLVQSMGNAELSFAYQAIESCFEKIKTELLHTCTAVQATANFAKSKVSSKYRAGPFKYRWVALRSKSSYFRNKKIRSARSNHPSLPGIGSKTGYYSPHREHSFVDVLNNKKSPFRNIPRTMNERFQVGFW